MYWFAVLGYKTALKWESGALKSLGKSGAFPDAVSSIRLLSFSVITVHVDGKIGKSGASQKTCQCMCIRSFREKSDE